MSTDHSRPRAEKLTFRRYKDGDVKVKRWQDEIFQARL
jgi:hypothetical protein